MKQESSRRNTEGESWRREHGGVILEEETFSKPGGGNMEEEKPGAARSSQEQLGAARSSQEQPGAARSSQEDLRVSKRAGCEPQPIRRKKVAVARELAHKTSRAAEPEAPDAHMLAG